MPKGKKEIEPLILPERHDGGEVVPEILPDKNELVVDEIPIEQQDQNKPELQEKPKYITFRDAWLSPENRELRKLTVIEGMARLGLSPEDKRKADELIKLYPLN